MPLTHSNLIHLFPAKVLNIFDELWLNGRFNPILEKLDALEWDDLTHSMIIYSMGKIMSLNRERIVEVFQIDPERYAELEIKLITDKVNSTKG